MTIPSSFCTICTDSCKQELVGFLLSLSLYHPNEPVYVMCDTGSKQEILNMSIQPKLDIHWFVELDKYTGLDRNEMTKRGIWSDFQMAKAQVIQKALEDYPDTLFLDSDTIILDVLDGIDHTKTLGVSPQFIRKVDVDRTGYYNGGMLWTCDKALPQKWIEYTKTSRYFDQASIEDLADEYGVHGSGGFGINNECRGFEFGENYNLQTWRFRLGLETREQIVENIKIEERTSENEGRSLAIYYRNASQPLKFIHTHFNKPDFQDVNKFFVNILIKAGRYRELAVIHRLVQGYWRITIPKQPMQGIGNHNNDSFREIPLLWMRQHKDVRVGLSSNTIHCWIEPTICLYDRPIMRWWNDECIHKANLFLLGNGDVEGEEGEFLNEQRKNGFQGEVKPWIFWPRRPMILEKTLNQGRLSYDERPIESIFIGNFENSVQAKYRNTNEDWETVLSEYHCTAGHTHKFTQEQYLEKLRTSRYGLCLRGFGSKCHREVELMAFGTVPVITPEVSIQSYYDPPVEGVHYLRVNSPEEFKKVVSVIPKEKWESMSKSCWEWFQRNVHSSHSWVNMMNYVLYHKPETISIFGASCVSQPRGFTYFLKKMLSDYNIEIHGYGGMHLNDAGIFYIDKVLHNNPKYCIIDWVSTGYIEYNKEFTEYIETIIYKCYNKKCIPIFLILPRRDITEERINMYNKLIDICKKYKCNYIYIQDYIKDTKDMLKDDVHLTEYGGVEYAKIIYNKLMSIIKVKQQFYSLPKKTRFNGISNVNVKTLKFKLNGTIFGIENKIGPYSPYVNIYKNNKLYREERIWDKHCFYERTHINFKNITANNDIIEIKISNKPVEYEECTRKNNWNNIKKQLKLLTLYYSGNIEFIN